MTRVTPIAQRSREINERKCRVSTTWHFLGVAMAAAALSAFTVPAVRRVHSVRARHARGSLRTVLRAVPDGDSTASAPDDDTPEWAKDLAIDENGDLIDTKTGKALNEFGATRFDVAVRAMRGEYDPPGVSTEMEQGQIYDTLTQFPTSYTFQASGKTSQLDEDGVAHVAGLIMEVCGCGVEETKIEIKPRGSGGKFVSLWVTCTVHSATMVSEALAAVKADARVMTCW